MAKVLRTPHVFVRTALLSLVLGFAATIGIAWSSALFLPFDFASVEAPEFVSDSSMPYWKFQVWRTPTAVHVRSAAAVFPSTSPVVRPTLIPYWSRASQPPESHPELGADLTELWWAEEARGWPVAVVIWRARFNPRAQGPDQLDRLKGAIRFGSGSHDVNGRFLAWHIVWPGFLTSLALYSLAAFVVLATPPTILRLARRRRGRCVGCGYRLLHEQARCPECGRVIRSTLNRQSD